MGITGGSSRFPSSPVGSSPLNLLSLNGGPMGLLRNLLTGKLVMPHRGSEAFTSAIGHLDSQVDLYCFDYSESPLTSDSLALMDLCIMASKLANENANVARPDAFLLASTIAGMNIRRKDQLKSSSYVTNRPEDADLILVSFRGTEPFDPDDWSTDFDYSWYEIPKMGKVHMGFLEALGLGTRKNASTFKLNLLQREGQNLMMAEFDKVGGRAGRTISCRLAVSRGEGINGEDAGTAYIRTAESFPTYDDKTFLYKHFGRCLYYDSFYNEQQVILTEPNRNYFGLRFIVSEYLNAIWELIRGSSMGHMYGPDYKETWLSLLLRVCGLVISAHSPTNYINSIRLGRNVQMRTL
uniref:Uncharacterized protein n=1 Tax=Ananas comosus var. bracteatus TaxID=296719 RepID=A0A6V7P518_ANACO|nr:unnamed protein product [Ananas comosus var. bracteatus]